RAQSFFEIIGPEVRAMAAVTCSTRSALVIDPPGRRSGARMRPPLWPVVTPVKCCLSRACGFPAPNGFNELAEMREGIVRSRCRLRVVLHPEYRQPLVADSFDGAIIEVEVGHLKFCCTWHALRAACHGETVVLGGYQHLAGRQLLDGVVAAPVAIGELGGLAPKGQAHQLVSQADPEHRSARLR